jgi:hypothetical protein
VHLLRPQEGQAVQVTALLIAAAAAIGTVAWHWRRRRAERRVEEVLAKERLRTMANVRATNLEWCRVYGKHRWVMRRDAWTCETCGLRRSPML